MTYIIPRYSEIFPVCGAYHFRLLSQKSNLFPGRRDKVLHSHHNQKLKFQNYHELHLELELEVELEP